jgi:hypothetical protein
VFTADASIQFSAAEAGPASQTFDYMFTLQSRGALSTTGRRNVEARGVLRVSASRASFADYLLITEQFKMANNGTVYFTSSDVFDGRVHTNDGFKFAFRPVFHDRVAGKRDGQFYNNGAARRWLPTRTTTATSTPPDF